MKDRIKDKIIPMLLDDALSGNDAIAAACGTSGAYVSMVRKELGLLKFKDLGANEPLFNGLSSENVDFVLAESKGADVTYVAMIDAILTDARVEAV